MGANSVRTRLVEAGIEQLGNTLLGLGAIQEREKLRVERVNLIERSGSAFALKGEEDVAQFTKSAVGANLGGAGGAFEDVGNLRKREFLKTAEQQDLAIIVVQSAQCDLEQGLFVASGGAIACVGSVVSVVVQILWVGWSRRGG